MRTLVLTEGLICFSSPVSSNIVRAWPVLAREPGAAFGLGDGSSGGGGMKSSISSRSCPAVPYQEPPGSCCRSPLLPGAAPRAVQLDWEAAVQLCSHFSAAPRAVWLEREAAFQLRCRLWAHHASRGTPDGPG